MWQHGREIAAWGEPDRADLTFSVAKSFLALLAGVAAGDGLLPDVHETVGSRLPGIGFDDSERNRAVTWAHLLTQTSEWSGTSFGLPDTVDRWRKVAQDPRPAAGPKGGARPLQPPGTYWEYNDVRINQLALALLHLFRAPLPEVFLERVLRPLGGGRGFAWRGYDDAWVDVPGAGRLQSVPGGSHWGGGVSISARDQARIGQLMLDGGKHERAAAHRRSLAALDGRAVRHRAVLRPAAVAQPRRQGLRRRVARGILHARRRRPHGVGGSCLQRRGRAALAGSGARARRDPRLAAALAKR